MGVSKYRQHLATHQSVSGMCKSYQYSLSSSRVKAAENDEGVAVEDFIDVGNSLGKSWVSLC